MRFTNAPSTPPRGPNLYAGPIPGAGDPVSAPNDITRDQWEYFFANIPWTDVKERLINDLLQAPSLMQALFGMVAQPDALWANFQTSPLPLPLPDEPGVNPDYAGPCGGPGSGFSAAPRGIGLRRVLQ